MSTDYRPLTKIRACELFDGRLIEWGINEHVKPDGTNERCRCLMDGRHYIWVFIDDDGSATCFTRYRANHPGKILRTVAEAFEVDQNMSLNIGGLTRKKNGTLAGPRWHVRTRSNFIWNY